MNLTPDDIAELQTLATKHPVVEKVLSEYKKLSDSPFLEGYLTIYRQIASWNKEIKEKSNKINLVQVQKIDEEGNLIGTLDKTFDNTLKYLNALPALYEKLEFFRSKLLPQELSDLKQHTSLIDKARNEIKNEV